MIFSLSIYTWLFCFYLYIIDVVLINKIVKQKKLENIMKKKLLKEEVCFAESLGLWLSLPKEQRSELNQMFSLDYGGLINACNRYMVRTIKAIGKGIVSFEEFSDQDAEGFSRLLKSKNLDNVLQSLLSRSLELKGPDENLLTDLDRHLESLKKKRARSRRK